jgi:hypothetical protein
MANIRERYVFDKNGRPIGVHLDLVEGRELLEELEAEQWVRAYDRARESGDEAIPFDQAVTEIERGRP